jgi:hypothetical protein
MSNTRARWNQTKGRPKPRENTDPRARYLLGANGMPAAMKSHGAGAESGAISACSAMRLASATNLGVLLGMDVALLRGVTEEPLTSIRGCDTTDDARLAGSHSTSETSRPNHSCHPPGLRLTPSCTFFFLGLSSCFPQNVTGFHKGGIDL